MTVSVIFRTDDNAQWGSGAGVNLTAHQIDQNFWNLKQAIETITLTEGPGIDHFVMDYANGQFTVVLSNNVTIGPYDFPRDRWLWRGDWAASTAYVVNDMFAVGSHIYIVLYPHTSGTTFNAGANDGAGHPYYQEMMNLPQAAIPVAGYVRQLTAKSSTTDYDLTWTWPFNRFATLSSTAYTLTALDMWDTKYFTNSSAITLTIPANSTAAIPVGAEVEIVQAVGAHSIAIVGASVDVEFLTPNGYALETAGEGAKVVLKKVDLNVWVVKGDLRLKQLQTLATTGSIAVDALEGRILKVTPTGNITLTATNYQKERLTLIVTTSGTTSYDITFDGTSFVSQGVLATGVDSAKIFTVQFEGDGTKYYEVSRTTAMT